VGVVLNKNDIFAGVMYAHGEPVSAGRIGGALANKTEEASGDQTFTLNL
jgi:hypothetical protein